MVTPRLPVRAPRIYPDNPHVRICGGPGSATTLVYPTKQVRELQIQEGPVPGPLLGGAEDRTVGCGALPTVQCRRDDVEIPANDERDIPVEADQVVAQRVEPSELPGGSRDG